MPETKKFNSFLEKALFAVISFMSMITVRYLDKLNDQLETLNSQMAAISRDQAAHLREYDISSMDFRNRFFNIEKELNAQTKKLDKLKKR